MIRSMLAPAARRVRRAQFHQLYRRYREFTMIEPDAFVDNLALASRLRNISGCIVECGVWRGGMSAGIASVLGPARNYFLFDSFQGLPGGWRLDLGDFLYLHERGYWWTKSNDHLSGSFAHSYGLSKDSTSVTNYATIQKFGLSVKCVKD